MLFINLIVLRLKICVFLCFNKALTVEVWRLCVNALAKGQGINPYGPRALAENALYRKGVVAELAAVPSREGFPCKLLIKKLLR